MEKTWPVETSLQALHALQGGKKVTHRLHALHGLQGGKSVRQCLHALHALQGGENHCPPPCLKMPLGLGVGSAITSAPRTPIVVPAAAGEASCTASKFTSADW